MNIFSPLITLIILLSLTNQTGTLPIFKNSFASVKNEQFEPPNDGAPGRREDAGSRPNCPKTEKPFTALIPITNLGITLSDYPTFWLYIPYDSGVIFFSLENEVNQKIIYQTSFKVTQGKGIISFQLPSVSAPLQANQKYRWKFSLTCLPDLSSDVLSVNGIIVKQLLNSHKKQVLENASSLQKTEIYATNGIWYELLTELAILYQNNPQDITLKQKWHNILSHPFVQLNYLIYEPFLWLEIVQDQ